MRADADAGLRGVAGAVAVLVAVRLALALLPFAWVARGIDRLSRLPIRLQRHPANQIAARVDAAARHVTGAACLAQALAARLLLAWHGHASVVRYGVRRGASRVEAHAWVEHDGRVVLGGPDVSAYLPFDTVRAPYAP